MLQKAERIQPHTLTAMSCLLLQNEPATERNWTQATLFALELACAIGIPR